MVNIGIIGATGYAGVELLRIALRHPEVKVAALSSVSFEGKAISEIYPNLKSICDDVLADEDTVIEKSDVVFASLPHGLCEPLAKKCVGKGALFIDLGADFRLNDEADYNKWYGLDYNEPELHKISSQGSFENSEDHRKPGVLSHQYWTGAGSRPQRRVDRPEQHYHRQQIRRHRGWAGTFPDYSLPRLQRGVFPL